MEEEWLALLDKSLITLTFSSNPFCKDVRYWIKRYKNGKYHLAVSTGNEYQLRNFEIYDENLHPCFIKFGSKNKWKCIEITETSLDATGSLCFIQISDPQDLVKKVRMNGRYFQSYGGFQQSINENFYFTALMLFLILLNKYTSWEDLQKQDGELFKDILDGNGIPQNIYKKAETMNSRIDLLLQCR